MKRPLIGVFQMNLGRAPPTPAALYGGESVWIRSGKGFLLFRLKLNHAIFLVRIAEGREDFFTDAKVRMVHVRAFHCLRKAESDSAKIFSGHRFTEAARFHTDALR